MCAGRVGRPGLCLGSCHLRLETRASRCRNDFLSCPPPQKDDQVTPEALLSPAWFSFAWWSLCPRGFMCGSCLSIFQVAVPCRFWKRGLFPSCLKEAARSASGRARKERCERNGIFLGVWGRRPLSRGSAPCPPQSRPGTWGCRGSGDLCLCPCEQVWAKILFEVMSITGFFSHVS